MNLELQQRAVEYNAIIREHDNLRDGLFETMPALEMKTNQAYTNGFNGDDLTEETLTEEELQQQQIKMQQEAAKTLLNIFSDDTPAQATAQGATTNNVDLLDGLFDTGSSSLATPAMNSTSGYNNKASHNNQIDLMGSDSEGNAFIFYREKG